MSAKLIHLPDFSRSMMDLAMDPFLDNEPNKPLEVVDWVDPDGKDSQFEPVETPVVFGPTPSPEQQRVIDAVGNNENIFITGVAGTGKSFLIDEIRKYYKVSVTATTGIAALNIGGSTIHSWAGLGVGNADAKSIAGKIRGQAFMRGVLGNIMNTHKLIIDEVSMLSADFLDLIDEVFKIVRGIYEYPFGGMQLILTGDFLQLPPVEKGDKDVRFCFESESWVKANIKTYELTKVFRQENQEFADVLGRLRMGHCSDADGYFLWPREGQKHEPGTLEPIRVFGTNNQADMLNWENLSKLPDDEVEFDAIDAPQSTLSNKQIELFTDRLNRDCLAPKKLLLKVGAQVMLLKNLKTGYGLVNGSMGVVVDFDEVTTAPIVKFNNGVLRTIERATWEAEEGGKLMIVRHQYPLRLAWGITIHKCVSENTLLDVENKGLVKISNVEAGQYVNTGFNTYRKILSKINTGIKDGITITTSNGYNITLSNDHLIYNGEKYIEAGLLAVGDYLPISRSNPSSTDNLIKNNFYYDSIVSINHVSNINMFDIEVDREHCFFANGFITHNCQGMTLDRVYCDLNNIFANGQAYVALSRAKNLEGLYLNGFHPGKIHANQKAVAFYKNLKGS